MIYVAITALVLGLAIVLIIVRHTLASPIPRTITSLSDAERLVTYHIDAANRRLRRDAWMLTFVVSHLDLEKRTATVRLGINYRGRGYPDYIGHFQQAWANARLMLRAKEQLDAAFAKRGFQADIQTVT